MFCALRASLRDITSTFPRMGLAATDTAEKNVALLLKLLSIVSDARDEINHGHMQRVVIVKVCTEAAGVRNSTSLHNSLACSECMQSSALFLLDQGVGFLKLLRVTTALCKQEHQDQFLKLKSD